MTHNPLKYAKMLREPNRLLTDLDDTIAKQIYPQEGIGEAIDGAIEAHKEFAKRHGLKIVPHSSRPSHDETNVREYFEDKEAPVERAEMGKPLGAYYSDSTKNVIITNKDLIVEDLGGGWKAYRGQKLY